MDRLSEAEDRALDARCRLPASPASRSSVVKLRALPPASLTLCIARYVECDLPHLVRCALDAGNSADVRWGEHNATVLSFAAENGSERALKALLVGRANVALADKRGLTAAHQAAAFGHAACLRLLIEAGANLEAKTYRGYFTPLLLAAQEGHAECCSLLLAKGVDANTGDDCGQVSYSSLGGSQTRRTNPHPQTPLMLAISQAHIPCVRVLLPVSDLSVTNSQGMNAFHRSILHLECFELSLAAACQRRGRAHSGRRDA